MSEIISAIIRESAKELQNEIDKMILREYEKEEKEMRYVWPIVVIDDRYSGVYSGGEYTAWNMYPMDIPEEVCGDDTECGDFFSKPNLLYGRGGTPQEAIDDLVHMVNYSVHIPTKNKKEKEVEPNISLQQAFKEINELKDLNAKLKKDIIDLTRNYNSYAAENCRLKRERDKLLKKNSDLQIEKERLGLEKNRIEADRKHVIEEHRKSDDEQCDRYKSLYEEFRQLKQDNDKLEKRNKYLNKQIDEMVFNANKKVNADEEPHSRRDILRCAEKCVCGKREQDYGTPESNFQLIADLWNGYLGGRTDNPVISVTPLDVSMMMALLKIARIRNGGGTGDSFVDLAGYAACGGEIHAQKKATEAN